MNGLLASRSARERNPSELVPSVLLAALAVHQPHGSAVGRSSRAHHVETEFQYHAVQWTFVGTA